MKFAAWIGLCVLHFGTVYAQSDEPPLNKEAKRVFGVGAKAYAAGDYQAAVESFEKAYSLAPRTNILYNWAQAERLSGDCASAIGLYERFLAAVGTHKEALDNIQRCHETLSTSAPATAPVPVIAELPPPVAPPPPPEPNLPSTSSDLQVDLHAPRPWYTDVLAGVLSGGGVISIGLGAYYFLHSRQSIDERHSAATYEKFSSAQDTARRQRMLGIVGVGAGVPLLAAGIIRYSF